MNVVLLWRRICIIFDHFSYYFYLDCFVRYEGLSSPTVWVLCCDRCLHCATMHSIWMETIYHLMPNYQRRMWLSIPEQCPQSYWWPVAFSIGLLLLLLQLPSHCHCYLSNCHCSLAFDSSDWWDWCSSVPDLDLVRSSSDLRWNSYRNHRFSECHHFCPNTMSNIVAKLPHNLWSIVQYRRAPANYPVHPIPIHWCRRSDRPLWMCAPYDSLWSPWPDPLPAQWIWH